VKTLIQNGPVVTPYRVIPTGGVLIEGEKIIEILERPLTEIPEGVTVIDAAGRYISPGFVDIHVHGGGGTEVMGATPAQIAGICEAHGRFGTTAMLPTTLAAPLDDICAAIDSIKKAKELSVNASGAPIGADILGAHLEGPYFSMAQRGAQAPEYIIHPNGENISQLLDRWDGVRIMGAAPEIPGGFALGRELTKRGITASVAHSDATFEEVEKAMAYGYADITHLYSACSLVKRVDTFRIAGVVEAGLFFDGLTAQIIADGRHLPASLLRLIYKCKGAGKVALISDGLGASADTGPEGTRIPEGTLYTQRNGVKIIKEGGVMKLADRSALAGSCATMSDCVRNMVQLAGVPLYDAVRMASMTPAAIVGAKDKGSLSPGLDADIVLYDEKINVSMALVRGRHLHFRAVMGTLL
jgi:N-acetylglucosamine-6-phosphate deacetylase